MLEPEAEDPAHPVGDKQGITLRDYFAAAALTGLLSNPGARPFPDTHDIIAQSAHKYADAMLHARATPWPR
jgi:hypothetical protein